MEQSSSGPQNSDPKTSSPSSDRNGDDRAAKDSGNQRMVADRLLAALASGNLDHLAQAREAFLKESTSSRKSPPPTPKRETAPPVRRERMTQPPPFASDDFEIPSDLEARLERRTAPRSNEIPHRPQPSRQSSGCACCLNPRRPNDSCSTLSLCSRASPSRAARASVS